MDSQSVPRQCFTDIYVKYYLAISGLACAPRSSALLPMYCDARGISIVGRAF